MLYLFKDPNGCLYSKNGQIATQGGKMLQATNGFLEIGDPTLATTGNVILAIDPLTTSDNNLDLMWIYPTDLDGHAPGTTEAYCLGAAGLGDILTPNAAGHTTRTGMDAYFWLAPLLANNATLADGITYYVYSGSVVYNSVTYTRGQTFKCTTAHGTSFTGAGYICNFFSFIPGADQNRKAWFSIINFCRADMAQPNNHYGEVNFPIEPNISTTTTDQTFFGHIYGT